MKRKFPIKVRSKSWLVVVISVWLAAIGFGIFLGARTWQSYLLFIAMGHIFGDWLISSMLLYGNAFEWRGWDNA
jgi:hypothetical protein